MASNNMVVVVGTVKSGKTMLLRALNCEFTTADVEIKASKWFDLIIPFEGKNYPFCVLEIDDIYRWSETYIKAAACVLVLIDSLKVTSHSKALNLLQKVKDLRSNIKIVIVSTKCDDRQIMRGQSSKLCPYVSTSTKTRLGIEELQRVLLRMAYPSALKKNNLLTRLSNFLQENLKSKNGADYKRARRSLHPSRKSLKRL